MKNLSSSAWAGVLNTQLILGLLLFVSAWTLQYWQAWLYWAVYAVATGFNTGYFLRHDPELVRRRLKAGPAAERSRNQQITQSISGVCIGLIFIVAGLDHRWSWSRLPGAMSLLADGLLIAALLLIFFVFRENSYTGSVVEVAPDQTVVSTGPYAWVRHPMYLASAVAFLVTPIALGSLWAWLAAVPATLMLAVRLVDEEQQLQHELPGYAAYRRQVRFRLLPGIW